jgi:hypothetical protein
MPVSKEVGTSAAQNLPELRQLFGAYLIEELGEEYGSPDAAVQAFKDQSSEQELARAATELRGLLQRQLSEEDLQDVLKWGLGSGYIPPLGSIRPWLHDILRTLES